MKQWLSILPLFLLCACNNTLIESVTITECSSMPEGRAAATSFVCNGKAYVFGGRTQGGASLNTLCRFDPESDRWEELGQTPLKPRVNAVAAVVRDTVYIGLGFSGEKVYTDSCYLQDFWQYVPSTGEWKRLPDYITKETNGCICFSDSNHIYTGFGYAGLHSRRMFSYSIRDSVWEEESISRLGIPAAVFSPVGAIASERYFTGTGFTTESTSQWFEYLPHEKRFVRLSSLPGKGRDSAGATGNDKYVYVFGGQRFGGTLTTLHFYDNIMRYSIASGSWDYCSALPCGGVIEPIAFSIGNTVYAGGGETQNGTIVNKLYRIEE